MSPLAGSRENILHHSFAASNPGLNVGSKQRAMKRSAGRAKKIAAAVAMLARGETIFPNRPKRPPSRPRR